MSSSVLFSLVLKENTPHEVYFLEDILCWLEFNTQEMESAKRLIKRGKKSADCGAHIVFVSVVAEIFPLTADTSRAVKMHYWLTGIALCSSQDFDYSDPAPYDGSQGIVS